MRVLVPALLLASLACSSAAPPVSTTPVTVQSQAPERSLRSSAAGERAFLTLAIRPHALAELGQAVRATVSSHLAPFTEQIDSGALFDEWLAGFTRSSRQGEVPGVLSWPGLDPARPIYIRIGEAPDDLGGVFDAMDGQGGESGPGSSYRHVMALPVTNVNALKQALAPFVGACSPEGNGHRCELGRVDFVEHDTWLFVVLRPLAPEPGEARNAAQDLTGGALMGPLGESEYQALHGDSPLAGLVRAAPIRSASVYHAAGMLSRALGSFVPGNVNQMQAAGTAELVGAFLRAARYGRELDSWAFAVHTQPLSIAVTGALSEVGAERYAAPPGADAVSTNASTTSAPIVVRSSYDLPALVGATPSPLGYQSFGEDHREARNHFRACGMGCAIRGLFEPAGYLSMASEGRPLSELMDKVRFEVHSELPGGTVDVDADMSQLIPMFFPANTHLHVRSRVDGARWVGGFALNVENAEHSLAFAQSHASNAAPAPQDDGDPASLQCLIALGTSVEAGLTHLVRIEGGFAANIERLRGELAESARCVTDPSHAAERDGYLRAFEVGAAPLADVTF